MVEAAEDQELLLVVVTEVEVQFVLFGVVQTYIVPSQQ
jgi:hypothetical protein